MLSYFAFNDFCAAVKAAPIQILAPFDTILFQGKQGQSEIYIHPAHHMGHANDLTLR